MKIFWIIMAALLLLFGLFTEELYRYVFCRGSSKLFQKLFDSKGHEPRYYQVRDEAADRLRTMPHEQWTIRSARGEQLQGFYYPCGGEGRRVAFLVHGYRSEHLETCGLFYDYYKSRNVDLFCVDHTAHGQSEGRFIGFDVLETPDCLQWIDELRKRLGENVEILLQGFSMGGGTVLQMSSHCPENVKCIVCDSGFSSAKAAMAHQIGPMYGPLRLLNRLIAGYDWNDSDVSASLSRSRIPILFVHGQDDKLVPAAIGPRLYADYQGPRDCLFAAHTRHIETIYTEPRAYAEKLDQQLARYFTLKENDA